MSSTATSKTIVSAALAVAWLHLAILPAGRAEQRQSEDSRITIDQDRETLVTKIRIQADDGEVTWNDVARGLARARGFDDSALQGIFPDGGFPIDGFPWQLIQLGLNKALQPGMRFSTERSEVVGGEPSLVIQLDRVAMLASQRRFQKLLRRSLVPDESSADYGLKLDDRWQDAPATKDLVVVLHGFGSRPEEVEGMLATVRKAGLPGGTFAYPNDQPIDESAELLSRELKQLAQDHPGRGVSLLTHSMGGLVARAAIEDPSLDPGNVRRLIMVAPPNHGSALAYFSFASDLWEHFARSSDDREVGQFYAAVEDGLSEASVDLIPDSVFLNRLNGRGRNANTRYSIFLGTGGPMTRDDVEKLRRDVAEQGQKNRWVRFFGSKVEAWLADLDEVVEGHGDGVVAVKRGRLDGVEDTVVLKFGHMSVTDATGKGDAKRVHEMILKRLE